MRKAHGLATIAALLALGGCASVPRDGGAAAVAGDGWAGIGGTTRAGAATITADALVEDSRCPMNARCVWAGRVVVAVSVAANGERSRANLILGEPQRIAGGTLLLDTVEPGRMANDVVTPGAYRFHFTWSA